MTQTGDVDASPLFRTARDVVHATDALTIRHMCDVAAIPAPGGAEAARAAWLVERLRELDLSPIIDDVGNVIATTPAADPAAPALVVASHLDSVFDASTDLTLRRDPDGTLHAPGISDNARGIGAMLAVARALHAVEWPLARPVVFLGSVGEEGAGDLRGVKHYFAAHAASTASFIALDGAGASRIINAAVGSRRLRITWRGPGGHSWSDFGTANAIHVATRAAAALTAIPLERAPRSTLSIGRIGGGTSINAIPADAWLEVDLRSEAATSLVALESAVRAAVAAHAPRGVACTIDVFGDRPAGHTDAAHPLVRNALAATRAVGIGPELAGSSTDANVAMSIGIPAIAIGAGGEAGGTHTLREWYHNRNGPRGVERALRIVLGVAG